MDNCDNLHHERPHSCGFSEEDLLRPPGWLQSERAALLKQSAAAGKRNFIIKHYFLSWRFNLSFKTTAASLQSPPLLGCSRLGLNKRRLGGWIDGGMNGWMDGLMDASPAQSCCFPASKSTKLGLSQSTFLLGPSGPSSSKSFPLLREAPSMLKPLRGTITERQRGSVWNILCNLILFISCCCFKSLFLLLYFVVDGVAAIGNTKHWYYCRLVFLLSLL